MLSSNQAAKCRAALTLNYDYAQLYDDIARDASGSEVKVTVKLP